MFPSLHRIHIYWYVLSDVMYMWCVVNRQERSHAQQLRDEQDEAYYESVRADQEKVRRLLLKF